MMEEQNQENRASVILNEEEQALFHRRIYQILNRHSADLTRNLSQNKLKLKKSPSEMTILRLLSDMFAINAIWQSTAHFLLSFIHRSSRNQSLQERTKAFQTMKQSLLTEISESMDEFIEECLREESDPQHSFKKE